MKAQCSNVSFNYNDDSSVNQMPSDDFMNDRRNMMVEKDGLQA